MISTDSLILPSTGLLHGTTIYNLFAQINTKEWRYIIVYTENRSVPILMIFHNFKHFEINMRYRDADQHQFYAIYRA